jgi:hypothetical protein
VWRWTLSVGITPGIFVLSCYSDSVPALTGTLTFDTVPKAKAASLAKALVMQSA